MATGKTIRVSDETHAALVKLAEQGFRSIAGTIEWLLRRVGATHLGDDPSMPSAPPEEKP